VAVLLQRDELRAGHQFAKCLIEHPVAELLAEVADHDDVGALPDVLQAREIGLDLLVHEVQRSPPPGGEAVLDGQARGRDELTFGNGRPQPLEPGEDVAPGRRGGVSDEPQLQPAVAQRSHRLDAPAIGSSSTQSTPSRSSSTAAAWGNRSALTPRAGRARARGR
jgi:hypothetical protein